MALAWIGVGSLRPAARVAWTSGAGKPNVLNIMVVDSGLSGSRHTWPAAPASASLAMETPHGKAAGPDGSTETLIASGPANDAGSACDAEGMVPLMTPAMMHRGVRGDDRCGQVRCQRLDKRRPDRRRRGRAGVARRGERPSRRWQLGQKNVERPPCTIR